MTVVRLVGWLLIVFVVVIPAARLASGGPPDVRDHTSIKHAPRTSPSTLRQGTLAGQPPVFRPTVAERVVAVDAEPCVRVVSDPPFVPPRG